MKLTFTVIRKHVIRFLEIPDLLRDIVAELLFQRTLQTQVMNEKKSVTVEITGFDFSGRHVTFAETAMLAPGEIYFARFRDKGGMTMRKGAKVRCYGGTIIQLTIGNEISNFGEARTCLTASEMPIAISVEAHIKRFPSYVS